METRMRSRAAEELQTVEGKDRDRKGKAVMKEEAVEEILEIYDDSEEEEDRREMGKKNKEYGGSIGGWAFQQTNEKQQT